MKLLAVALCMALTACATKTLDSSFKPKGDGTYEYEAFAGIGLPADSPAAEATRIEWLEQYLVDNRLCPNGYEIRSRQPVVVASNALGTGHRIYYTVACKA